MAFFPFDYIFQASKLPLIYSTILKLFRLLKIIRVMKVIEFIKINSEKKTQIFKIIFFCLVYIILNHFCACLMFLIAYFEHEVRNVKESMVNI